MRKSHKKSKSEYQDFTMEILFRLDFLASFIYYFPLASGFLRLKMVKVNTDYRVTNSIDNETT